MAAWTKGPSLAKPDSHMGRVRVWLCKPDYEVPITANLSTGKGIASYNVDNLYILIGACMHSRK